MKKLIAAACLAVFAAAVLMPFGSAWADCDKNGPKTHTTDTPAPKSTRA